MEVEVTGSSSSFDSVAFSFIGVLLWNSLEQLNCAVTVLEDLLG